MDITRPTGRIRPTLSQATRQRKLEESEPPKDSASPITDYVSRGVGGLGGALQVALKTPRNAIASFTLPSRITPEGEQPDVPALAKDPELTGPWGFASALGGAIFLGAMAGLTLGGPIAVALGAGVGAKLFQFVDDKLADRARAEGKAPVFVDGALAKGHSKAAGESKLEAWSNAFSTMSKSSYVEVRDWYTEKVKDRLSPQIQ